MSWLEPLLRWLGWSNGADTGDADEALMRLERLERFADVIEARVRSAGLIR